MEFPPPYENEVAFAESEQVGAGGGGGTTIVTLVWQVV